MATQDQVDGMVLVQHVEDVGRMGQEQREPVLCRWRNTRHVGAVKGRIINTDDREFPGSHGNERTLVDEQRNFMPIGKPGILRERYPAVVVVISQSDKDRRDLA